MTDADRYDLLRAAWPGTWCTAPYDLNVFGLRGPDRAPDAWDDALGVAYVDDAGAPRVRVFAGTTDPGGYYLEHPLTPLGTVVVEAGYHPGLWAPGLHHGYPALVQVGQLRYRRDDNRDLVIDETGPEILASGNGVNFHHGYGSAVVGRNSAGCQVVRDPADLATVLQLVDLQRAHGHGDHVSYGLVEVAAHPELAALIPPAPARTLRRGCTGPDVATLQRRLGVEADGVFGPGTEAAVRAFQGTHGLVADGIVGSGTRLALGV